MSVKTNPDFIHLHNHSHYSVLDGALTIDHLIDETIANKLDAVALTDHGNMFGAIEFYKKSKEKGIKPLLGCELYIAPGKLTEKIDVRSLGEGENSYHLVLLAKDKKGYDNLLKMSTIGYLEGFYYKPRVDLEVLAQHSEGLIAMTACLAGEVPNKIIRRDQAGAMKRAGELCDIFGRENFFVELQYHEIEIQKTVNQSLINMANKMNFNLVASNDIHYRRKSDSYAHEVLLCIQTGKTLKDEKRMRFSGSEFYYKTPQQMHDIFYDVPKALSNTRLISDMIDLQLTLDIPILPNYQVPEGFNLNSYLETLAWQGLKQRYKKITESIEQRLKYELNVIKNMDFAGYFLIVQDFIQFAKQQDIPVGPGRGSAAGSLVSYCLGITDIDPLQYNLLFERFLNPDRIEMPDVDIDFCKERRDEVIKYVQNKYGADKVGQVIAFGTIKSKNAIKDVGRVMDVSYAETDRLAKLIPGDPVPVSLTKALEQSKELYEYYQRDDDSKLHIDTSLVLEGFVRQATKHAAGVVIARGDLTDYSPLYRDKDGAITTQYEKNYLEAVGLVKMDFLGLKNLTVIDKALKIIKEKKNISIDFSQTDPKHLEDEKTFELLAQGRTNGVFQLESPGMQDLLRKAKPKEFEDIIAILALYRPGPLNAGMVDTYIERKDGRQKISYDHPALEPILKGTYGVIVYQEQVMMISQAIGGFSMADADMLRKIMGKKLLDKMPAQREKFLFGAKNNKIDQTTAEKIFDLCATFGEYGFNKSHSAAYALITYRTAYLKVHFPVEYMAALLSADMDDTDKVVKYLHETRQMGIKIMPPDIQLSEKDFSATEDGVTFGLSAIKNIGDSLVGAILTERKTRSKFLSIYDFVNRIQSTNLNTRAFESLVQAGAFDSMGYKRKALFNHAETLLKEGQAHQKDQAIGQFSLFASIEEVQQPDDSQYRQGREWSDKERLSREKNIIGFYISGHPMDIYREQIENIAHTPLEDLKNIPDSTRVMCIGVIEELRIVMSKKNKKNNAFFILADQQTRIDVVVFNTVLEGGKDRSGQVFESVQGKLQANAVIAVEADLQKEDEGKVKLIMRCASSLEEAQLLAISALHLDIVADKCNDALLSSLHNLIRQHHGDRPVYMHFDANGNGIGKKILCVAQNYWIKPSHQFLDDLENLMGKRNVIRSYGF